MHPVDDLHRSFISSTYLNQGLGSLYLVLLANMFEVREITLNKNNTIAIIAYTIKSRSNLTISKEHNYP